MKKHTNSKKKIDLIQYLDNKIIRLKREIAVSTNQNDKLIKSSILLELYNVKVFITDGGVVSNDGDNQG